MREGGLERAPGSLLTGVGRRAGVRGMRERVFLLQDSSQKKL